jgi:hypothetical protein
LRYEIIHYLYNLDEELDIKEIFLWDEGEYDYRELEVNVVNVKEALYGMSEAYLERLKKYRIVLTTNSMWDKVGVRETGEGEKVIAIDSRDGKYSIQEDILDALDSLD